jgi:hypothetical protein
MAASPNPSALPPVSPPHSGRFVAHACVAPPGEDSPQRTRRLSYLEAATSEKRSPIDHATRPRGAEPPAKKAPRRSSSPTAAPGRALLATHDVVLAATVSRTAAAAATSEKRSAIDHATPPRGAEPPAKKAPHRSSSPSASPGRVVATHDVVLVTTVSRTAAAAATSEERSAIYHATPPHVAEQPAKKARRRSPSPSATHGHALLATHDVVLVATVSRTAAAGAFAPFSRGRNVNVRVRLDDASASTAAPTVALALAQTDAAAASRAGVPASRRRSFHAGAPSSPSRSSPDGAPASKKKRARGLRPIASRATKTSIDRLRFTPRPSPTPTKKGVSSTGKNMKAVINGRISEWARKDRTFSVVANAFTNDEHASWVAWFQRQMRCRFQNANSSSEARAEDIGLGRRSDARDDLLLDEDARLCDVTDARRLSRCHFEDLLRMQTDSRLVLYFQLNTIGSGLHQTFHQKPFLGSSGEKKPWVAGATQRSCRTGGTTVTIAGNKYLVLKATVQHARAHHDAIAGVTNLAQLKKQFQQNEGFTVVFD